MHNTNTPRRTNTSASTGLPAKRILQTRQWIRANAEPQARQSSHLPAHANTTGSLIGCESARLGARDIPTDLTELVRLSTVRQITGISRPQIYRLMQLGRFPNKIKIGRSTAWVRKEINDWVQQRIAERDSALAA
ncbi:helix-turn-helix transcriptional regulator [Cupriavidus sp. 8B]